MIENRSIIIETIKALTEHRQTVTSTYLSVNTAIIGAVAFLFKDGQIAGMQQSVAVLVLLGAGVIVCDLWRRLILQYEILLEWWYERLREGETDLEEENRIFTREYIDLYRTNNGEIGLSRHQILLTWLFISIYLIFGIAITSNVLSTL